MSAGPADLPSLDNDGPIVSSFEFLPAWRFYLPLVPHILGLMLRHGPTTLTAANPAIPGGGLVGESKTDILDLVVGPSRDLIAPYLRVKKAAPQPPEDLSALLEGAGVSFPAVAKPDMSCRGAGIRKVETVEDIAAYWAAFPEGADLVIQSRIEMEPEAGIFYIRPAQGEPFIFSLTLKYTASVTGDGHATLRELIANDARAAQTADVYFAKPNLDFDQVPGAGERIPLAFAGNHCRGAIFRDGAEYITAELTGAIHKVLTAMPGFHFGRLDVRFECLARLQKGEGFKIIEINGVGSEATHIWDNRFTLAAARKVLRDQYTHAFEIGAHMRRRGAVPTGIFRLLNMWWRERKLTKRYPVSD